MDLIIAAARLFSQRDTHSQIFLLSNTPHPHNLEVILSATLSRIISSGRQL